MSLSYCLARPIPISIALEEATDIFQTLGTKDEVIAVLAPLYEQLNWLDTNELENSKLEISGHEYWVEFSVASEDGLTIDFLMTDDDRWFGDRVFDIFAQICQETGWRVFDLISGIFVNVVTWEEETEWHVPEALSSEEALARGLYVPKALPSEEDLLHGDDSDDV